MTAWLSLRPAPVLRAAALALAACADGAAPIAAGGPASSRAGAPGTHRQYGTPVKVGNGRARSYVVLDAKQGGAPREIGFALDATALDGLRSPTSDHGGGHQDEFILPLPPHNGTPFQTMELDWSPMGHGVPHTTPHFDFHFYTITLEERNAIVPTDPAYAEKAARFPAPGAMLPGWIPTSVLASAPPAAVAVPRMGLHWVDPTSPELPPTLAPFTKTMIMGSWDGRVTFYEPMITRDYLAGHAAPGADADEVIPVPFAAKPDVAGYYPGAYRIQWDAHAKEYRVALTQLAWRE